MSRYFRVTFGQKTVRPLKKDLNNMIVNCKKNIRYYEEKEDKEQIYLWNRNYKIY